MSSAGIREVRDRSGFVSKTKTQPVEAGGCPACGHPVLTLQGSTTDYCPCEDCHSGGHVVRKTETLTLRAS